MSQFLKDGLYVQDIKVESVYHFQHDIGHERMKSNTTSTQLPVTLFVDNLFADINERVLEEMFSTFGRIKLNVLYNDMTSTNPYSYSTR